MRPLVLQYESRNGGLLMPVRPHLVPIGRRIRERRDLLGLSQSDLAGRLKMESQTISKWERGVIKPSGDSLLRLAEAFGVSPAWIINGKDGESGAIEDPPDSPGWLDFVAKGYPSFFRARGLTEEHLAYVRRAPFPHGPPLDYRPYAQMCEAMLLEHRAAEAPVAKAATRR